MADDTVSALQAIRNANTKWLGYRYVIISVPAGGITLTNVTKGLLPAAGVSEIVFPTAQINLKLIPTLSTVERYIPSSVSYGNLILRAPTLRATALFDRFNLQLNALKRDDLYKEVHESIIIGEFETTSISDLVPIAVWAARGVQAKSFKPAPANAQGHGAMPLEELVLQVEELVGISGV
jgi:hypothetical protein